MITRHRPRSLLRPLAITLVALLAACDEASPRQPVSIDKLSDSQPLRVALAAHTGDTELDHQIAAVQAKLNDKLDDAGLERLATLFITKARVTGDAGFYKQAEACADAMPNAEQGKCSAQLVRGHVRHALHDFPAAEAIARELVEARGLFLDHGLLGDVLFDQGRLEAARDVYQKMLDLKPCLQSYSRAAQVRWLIGDAIGCRELLGNAAAAGSQRDPESLAWVMARLATLELHFGDFPAAMRAADKALELVPDYPAGLFARGRAAWGLKQLELAVSSFAAAVARYPLPEHLWAYSDALLAVGKESEAIAIEAELYRTGEREDPRTFALWLATTDRDPACSLRLAQAEHLLRQDAFTWDVLAMARLRSGDVQGASTAIRAALVVGVCDARVMLHAALIEQVVGERTMALTHLQAARERRGSLLPSEQALLLNLAQRL